MHLVYRAAVQAAMDAAAASGTAFSKKRTRAEGGDAATGDPNTCANTTDGSKAAAQEDSADDDEEEDVIPIKRPRVESRPALKMQPQPTTSSVASHIASEGLPDMPGGGASMSGQQDASTEAPAGDAQTAAAPAVAMKPPVAAPMRPPVARGHERSLPARGGVGGGPV